MRESSHRSRICFLVDIFITGGVERVVIEAARILSTYYDVILYAYTGVIDDNYAIVELCNIKMDVSKLVQLSMPFLEGRIINKTYGSAMKFDVTNFKKRTSFASS